MLLALADTIALGKFKKLKCGRCDSRLFGSHAGVDTMANNLTTLEEFPITGKFSVLGVDIGYDDPPLKMPEIQPQGRPWSPTMVAAQPVPVPAEGEEEDDL